MKNISYQELLICQKYANEVIGYCRNCNMDLSGPDDARQGILEFDRKCFGFHEWFGYDLCDYIDNIITEIGMILEQE